MEICHKLKGGGGAVRPVAGEADDKALPEDAASISSISAIAASRAMLKLNFLWACYSQWNGWR